MDLPLDLPKLMFYLWVVIGGLVAQLCLTLCYPIDCSLPGSSVHGIFQARVLEWVAISFFRGYSQPRDRTHESCASCIGRQVLYHLGHFPGGSESEETTSSVGNPV